MLPSAHHKHSEKTNKCNKKLNMGIDYSILKTITKKKFQSQRTEITKPKSERENKIITQIYEFT